MIRPIIRPPQKLISDPLAMDKPSAAGVLPWDTRGADIPQVFLPGGDFERLGEGSYLVSDGATPMRWAPTDVLRLEDQGDGAGPLVLLTRAATNPVLFSEDFTNAAWALVSTPTITPNTSTAPDGGNDGTTITDDNVAAAERIRQAPVLGGVGNVIAALYILRAAAAPPFPAIFYQGGGDYAAALNPLTGATSAVAPFAAPSSISVDAIGTAWWHLHMRRPSVVGAALDLAPAFSNPIGTFDAAATGSSQFWGAHVEDNQNYCTDYIRTTNVAVTRGADVLTMAALPLWFFTEPGRFTQFSPIFASTDLVAGNIRWLFTIGGASNGVRLRHDGANVVAEAVQGGVVRATSGALVFAEDALLGEVLWNNEAGTISVGGVSGAVGTPWTWTRDVVRFGGIYNSSGSELDGRLSQLAVRA